MTLKFAEVVTAATGVGLTESEKLRKGLSVLDPAGFEGKPSELWKGVAANAGVRSSRREEPCWQTWQRQETSSSSSCHR